MRNTNIFFVSAFALCFALLPYFLNTPQVLGPCGGTPQEQKAFETQKEKGPLMMGHVPLPGERALDFNLPAVVGDEIKMIKLSDYQGKWRVVCFYPADFTFVWPTELSAVAEVYEELKKLNVEVISISTDTHFSHWMWKKTSPTVKNVKYPMASDPSGAVSRAYGVFQEGSGLNHRGRFIINPDGIVMAVEVLTGPVGRNVHELIRQIKAMQAVAANPGKAAPAGWKPGDPLIDTGKEYIGKY
jgi:alkyl hydroperoxide reductase subunit AhpC